VRGSTDAIGTFDDDAYRCTSRSTLEEARHKSVVLNGTSTAFSGVDISIRISRVVFSRPARINNNS
jgi:hypothetical protein